MPDEEFHEFMRNLDVGSFNSKSEQIDIQRAKRISIKNRNTKIAMILGVIVASFITASVLDYFVNDDPVKLVRYQLTEQCWMQTMIATNDGRIIELEFDCNSSVTTEEVSVAMGLLKEKSTELGYKIKIPFLASQLAEQFQRKVNMTVSDPTGSI